MTHVSLIFIVKSLPTIVMSRWSSILTDNITSTLYVSRNSTTPDGGTPTPFHCGTYAPSKQFVGEISTPFDGGTSILSYGGTSILTDSWTSFVFNGGTFVSGDGDCGTSDILWWEPRILVLGAYNCKMPKVSLPPHKMLGVLMELFYPHGSHPHFDWMSRLRDILFQPHHEKM